MNRRRTVIAAALISLFLVGCGAEEEQLPVSWEMKNDRWQDEDCAEGGPCSYVAFAYPIFSGAENPAEKLNDRVRGWLARRAGEERKELSLPGTLSSLSPPLPSPEETARAFLESFRKFKADFPESPQVWFLERTVEVLPSPRGTISFRAEERIYSGGAHGNETAMLSSFAFDDHGEPHRILRPDIFLPDSEAALFRAAEKRFREVRGLDPEADLREAGFWFDEERGFRPWENFALLDEGIAFHFDSYEVGPYALGPTDYIVPWADLESILNEKWARRIRE